MFTMFNAIVQLLKISGDERKIIDVAWKI